MWPAKPSQIHPIQFPIATIFPPIKPTEIVSAVTDPEPTPATNPQRSKDATLQQIDVFTFDPLRDSFFRVSSNRYHTYNTIIFSCGGG